MNNGVLIFAQNSKELDYALMALISGTLAKKNLNVPVSLAADTHTINWMKQSNIYAEAISVFDKIIEIDVDRSNNIRNIKDGTENKTVPFKNAGRFSAWKITPYDRTLLIDSDFLIFSNSLSQFWEIDEDIMISRSMLDLANTDRSGYHDKYISDTGIHLYWATTIMFTKNEKSKVFFDLVEYIKENYSSFSDTYRFDSRMYRNDISFSIAKHIFDGFSTNLNNSLPPIPTTLDCDVLEDVSPDGRLTFIMSQDGNLYYPMSTIHRDVHVMNKQSLIRNKEKLLGLI